jgi:hypothetical protein
MFHSILLATSTRIQYKIYFFVGQKLAITKQKENSIICIFKKKSFANWWHLNTKGNFYKTFKRKTSTQARVVKGFPLGGYNDCDSIKLLGALFHKGPTYLPPHLTHPMDRWPSMQGMWRTFEGLPFGYMCHSFSSSSVTSNPKP